MDTKRKADGRERERSLQDVGATPPPDMAEERRLTLRIGRLGERLMRLLRGLPEPHRCRVVGGVPLISGMAFSQLETIVARLAREAEEHGDGRLAASAVRARAVLSLLGSTRSTLVSRNLGLVYYVAKRLDVRKTIFDDIVQVGNLALLEAADRFDPQRGTTFASYARICITGEMLKAIPGLTQEVRHSPDKRKSLRQLEQSQYRLAQDLGREPTLAETAAETRINEEEVREIFASKPTMVALDAPRAGSERLRLADILAADDAMAMLDQMILRELLDHLQEILASLEPRLRTVLRLRYGLQDDRERTLEEVGETMRLSKERIRQLEEEALALLRIRMRRLLSNHRSSRTRPAWAARHPSP